MAIKVDNNCDKCFCKELCWFIISRVGIITSCNDFRNRVRNIVDKEINSKENDNNGRQL